MGLLKYRFGKRTNLIRKFIFILLCVVIFIKQLIFLGISKQRAS